MGSAAREAVDRGRILPRAESPSEEWQGNGGKGIKTGEGLDGTGYASARDGEAFERGRINPHVTSGGGKHLTHTAACLGLDHVLIDGAESARPTGGHCHL